MSRGMAGAGAAALLLAGPGAAQDDLRVYAPGTPPFGVGGTPERLGFAILPQDDDLSRPTEGGGLARFNHIPLGRGAVLSFQGIGDLEAQIVDDANYGLRPDDDTSIDQRLNLYAGLSFGRRARLYAALKSADRTGDELPTSPVERDDLDLHMAFAEVAFGDILGGEPGDALLRVGRQELHYGAGRMISIRNGPNVRDDFDGAIVRARLGPTVAEGFGVYEVEDDAGPFDNDTDTDQGVWGVYTTTATPGGDLVDLYYIGQRATGTVSLGGPTDDTRHYLGARWFRQAPDTGLGFDVEGTYLFGTSRDAAGRERDIDAWSLTGEANISRDAWIWSPNLRLRAGVTSGDKDPGDDEVGTFRAPHPPGRYFGEYTPIGPGNLTGVTAAVEFEPREGLTVTPYALAFWRLEEADGSYTPAGTLNRDATGDERYLGWQANLLATHVIDRNWTLFGEVGVFEPGPYIDDNPPAEPIAFGKIALQLRF